MLRRRRSPKSSISDDLFADYTEDDAAIDAFGMQAIDSDDPVHLLAVLLHRLLSVGVVSSEELQTLGFSPDGVEALVDAFEENGSPEEVVRALEVSAALRHYDAELAVIAGERGVSIRGEDYLALRSAIAGFSEENDLLDVRAAYERMIVECPERLPPRR